MVVVALVLLALPLVLSQSRINLVAVAVIYAVIALSLVVLTGWGGEISLGQMAFVAIGAAVGGSITARWGWDLGLGLLGAGLVGAAVATLIGLPVLRRRGLTIAVITLSFSLMTTAWLLNPQFFGEGARFDWLPPPRIERTDLFGFIDVRSETRFYFLCLVALGARHRRGRGIRRSRTGRVLIATPRERTGDQRVRREHAPEHAGARSRSRGSSPRSRARCSCTTRTGSNSTRTRRRRASWCSPWS